MCVGDKVNAVLIVGVCTILPTTQHPVDGDRREGIRRAGRDRKSGLTAGRTKSRRYTGECSELKSQKKILKRKEVL